MKPSALRVAHRYLTAKSDAEVAAEAMFTRAVPPDGGTWNGGAPEVKVSFSGVQARGTKVELPGLSNERHVETVLTAEAKPHGADGIYCDSYLLTRFRQTFPGDDSVLLAAFMREVKKQESSFKAQIKAHYEDPRAAWRVKSDVFGFREADEYELPTNVRIKKVVIGKKPTFLFPRRSDIHLTWGAHVTFDIVKLAPVTTAPFTEMSDRELDSYIQEWENEAPENFWMDGELRMSRRDAYRMYRDRWRKMTPREQVRMMNSLR